MADVSMKTEREIIKILYRLLDDLKVDHAIDGYDSAVQAAQYDIVTIIENETDDAYEEGKKDGIEQATE